uniref:helix-hairpin-helix domain-containing protein n=1 Tax=uncultured Draconibacterium sp. TaxID=1573823 RepID=UPI0032166D28
MSNNAWQKILKGFLSYSRSDRNAIIIIGALILVVVIANTIVVHLQPKPNSDFSEIQSTFESWEKTMEAKKEQEKKILFDFDPNLISSKRLDSLAIPHFVKRNLLSYRNAGGTFQSTADVRKIYGMNDSVFSVIENHIKIKVIKPEVPLPKPVSKIKPEGFFDPNETNTTELTKFGFNNYQANNLVNYRKKGGVFIIPSDILKIYGIDSSFYFEIEKHIRIKKIEADLPAPAKEIVMLELNEADSTDLVKLKGIGPAYANRIIKYRKLLGGFYTKEQLKEVYNLPEETYIQIRDQLFVDTTRVKKLRINFSEYAELLKHPYFSRKQVEALLSIREQKGAFKNVSDLRHVEGFDAEIIMKISPYVTCR